MAHCPDHVKFAERLATIEIKIDYIIHKLDTRKTDLKWVATFGIACAAFIRTVL